uniref:Aldehyde dehydrogenase n=1 Tax=Klebsiella pneumoniae TaxID=573 RepID=A0A5P1PM62_KLEPN|nr:Aldehyde dehydrogenase [Klebsiella pneumoniae]
MHHHGVAGAGEAYQRFQLRTLDILAGCLVAKSAINLDAFQLPFRVLVEGADPDIPNAALLQIVGGDKLIIPFC